MVYRRGESRDFARFLRIARGSACELEAQATIAARVGLGDGEADVSPLIRSRTTPYVLLGMAQDIVPFFCDESRRCRRLEYG